MIYDLPKVCMGQLYHSFKAKFVNVPSFVYMVEEIDNV